jgi:hypothetical protein
MTIFGVVITTDERYKADMLAAHTEEYESHRLERAMLERQVEEAAMQRDWWRSRFEALERRAPRTVRLRPNRTGIEVEVER